MAASSLQHISAWLQESSTHLIGLHTHDHKFFETGINASGLDQKYGGFIKMLEAMYNQGYTSVSIYKADASGNAQATQVYPLKTGTPSQKKTELVEKTTKALEISHPNSTNTIIGLTGVDYVQSLKRKIAREKEKRKKEKSRRKKAQSALLEYEQTPTGLTGANITSLLENEVLIKNVVDIATLFKPVSKQDPGQPQATAAQPTEISPTKQFVIDFIKKPEVTDDHASLVYQVVELINKGNQPFTNALVTLVKQHNPQQ